MDIITTHANADFDSLASMIAAKRLYPTAELVFPGAQQRRVRQYLSQEFRHLYAFKTIEQAPLEKMRRLVLVATRHPDTIGSLGKCLSNRSLSLHLYDHHPDTAADLRGEVEHLRRYGATTTIFATLFQEQGIKLNLAESTLMALGIYENTAGLLHPSTRPEDLQAVSWLLDQGADLGVIRQFLDRGLSTHQDSLLNEVRHAMRNYPIGGARVGLSSIRLSEWIFDFSTPMQSLMISDNLDALLIVIYIGDKAHLMAHSRIPELNVGVIARHYGGGGHASAASATLDASQCGIIEDELIVLLHQYIRPRALASTLMTTPVIAATPDLSINEAEQLLTRYNVTVLPVVRQAGSADGSLPPTGLLGIISRMVVQKAIFHQLGQMSVAEVMTSDIASLKEEASLAEILELINSRRQRLIPVRRGESIVGVITRTDLIRVLLSDPANLSTDLLREDERPSSQFMSNVSTLMARVLPRDLLVLLREIGEAAAAFPCQAYVAGGFVRDLLLRKKNTDIDIVIEGDGLAFARALAKAKGGEVREHAKFSTATVIFPDQTRIDVATARLEYYNHPAALPVVEPSSLKLDLSRRDFTVNAMAIGLNPRRFGNLIDYFNSRNDLKAHRIQVLHNLSFIEDPTRIFRAIRFERRLNFTITAHSKKLIHTALGMNLLDRIEPSRLLHEIQAILSEPDPIPALQRMESFGLLPHLWPELELTPDLGRRVIQVLIQTRKALAWFQCLNGYKPVIPWQVYLLAILSVAGPKALQHCCQRFGITAKLQQKMMRQKIQAEHIATELLANPKMKVSEVSRRLAELDSEGLLYLMAAARKNIIKEAVVLYLTQLRAMTPLVNGDHLKAMGYAPGPQFKEILNRLLDAQLDGAVQSVEGALEFIRKNYPPSPRPARAT